jgi:uncharacterized protein with beta-barrel porin domain
VNKYVACRARADINAEGQAKGYNYTIGAATFGVDYRPLEHFVIGLMGGYAHTWTSLNPGSVDLNTGWGGLYAGYSSHGFYVLGSAFGGGGSLDTSRADITGGRANSSSNTQQWSTFVTVGYDFHCGQLTIGPLFAAQYSYINLNSFEEHGSIADLSVNERSSESWRTDLGLRA